MVLLILLMILKDTEFQDGSSTETKISKKVKISKLLLTSFKQNLEKILKDFIKSDVTKVSDTNGVLKLEVNTQRQQVEEEKLLVLKERKSDCINLL
jgi:hypothetical protein